MALLSGAGAVMIALLMVGSAAAANANTVLHPRFHGVVAPHESTYVNGCGSSAKLGKAKFSLRTGNALLGFSGKAGACAKVPKGFSFYNSASASQGFEAVIALPHATNATTNVTANWAGKYSYTAALTTGTRANSCPGSAVLNYFWYNYTYDEWGYNATTFSFSSYAYNDTDYGYSAATHAWFSYNSSYNWASVPTPFNLNNTSYQDHFAYNEIYSSFECDSSASWDIQTTIEVCDTNAGFCWYETGSTGFIFQYAGISLINDVYWESPSVDSYWYGPSSYSYNYTYPAYNGNTTGSTWYYENETSTSFTYQTGGTPNATSISASGVVNLAGQSSWANYSSSFYGSYCASYGYYCITNGDHLYAEIMVSASMSASNNNWAHGSASFAFNGATLGNGIKLGSIVY